MRGHLAIAAGAVGKLRRPWAVAALSLVPFYWIVWYFRINREMRDFGGARADARLVRTKPLLSVLAVTVGGLVLVPPFVSLWRTVRRIQACERAAGSRPARAVGMLVILNSGSALAVASGLIGRGPGAVATGLAAAVSASLAALLMQRRLNAVWRRCVPIARDPEHRSASVVEAAVLN